MKVTKFVLAAACCLLPVKAMADQGVVSQLNEILRGELSAVETYRQAVAKSGGIVGSETLKEFHDEHADNVSRLRSEIQKLGGTPTTDSGAWGVWAKTVMGSAKILGDKSALQALRQGEEHGLNEYNEVLKNKNVPAPIKDLVQNDMLPGQQEHIQELSEMIGKL
jgi:uncharacterized protein (TIGR02284 family)